MKFTTVIASLALFSSLTVAADTTNVKSIIKSFFPSQTPTIAASKSTALASALVSHQSTWDNSPLQTSVNNAIFSAAPSSVSKSYASSGYYYDQVVTASWFTKSVPAALQTAVQNEIKAFDAVVTSVIGTSTSKAGAAASRATEAAVVGAVGVMGVVMAVL